MWTFVLGIVVCVLLVCNVIVFYHNDYIDPSGKSVSVNISNFGFGTRKQLIVFDVDVDKIDMSNKIFAPMAWSDVDTPLEWQPSGIEIKGSGLGERKKLNWAFEIWGPANSSVACTSVETCKDDKAELFQFDEDYEDYVLRGGFMEPTLIRDVVPSQMKGGILQHTLVDVLFKHESEYTYEGTYILYPSIQRRLLEKRLNWDKKGKAKCNDVDEAALIGEFTQASKGRKYPCEEFDLDVKMRYPKCDMEECLHNKTNEYFSLLSMTNTTEVHLDIQSFADTFLMEKLMINGDFPFASQYFYVDPDNLFHSGPRWDFDECSWRFPRNTWDFYNNFISPMPLWLHLGTYEPFLELLELQRKSTTQLNYDVFQSVAIKRINQYKLGYFDKNIARWKPFGNKYISSFSNPYYLLPTGFTKQSMLEEIEFINQTLFNRKEWMLSNKIESFKQTSAIPQVVWVIIGWVGLLLVVVIVFIVSLVVSI